MPNWKALRLYGNQTIMRNRTKRFQSPMTILHRLGLGLGLASAAAVAGQGRLVHLKTRKEEMRTKNRSLKVMAPSRPAPPFEGILKLKTAPALTMSVVERMRSDKAKNMKAVATARTGDRGGAHGRRACRKAGAKRGPRRDGATRLIESRIVLELQSARGIRSAYGSIGK